MQSRSVLYKKEYAEFHSVPPYQMSSELMIIFMFQVKIKCLNMHKRLYIIRPA